MFKFQRNNDLDKIVDTPFGKFTIFNWLGNKGAGASMALAFPVIFILQEGGSLWAPLYMTLVSMLIIHLDRYDSFLQLYTWKYKEFALINKTYVASSMVLFPYIIYARSMAFIFVWLVIGFWYIAYRGFAARAISKELMNDEIDFSEFHGEPAAVKAYDYKFLTILVLSIWMIAWSFDFKRMPLDPSIKYINIDIAPPELEQVKAATSSAIHSIAGLDDMVKFCSYGDERSCAWAGGIYLSSKDQELYTKAFKMLAFSCSEGSLAGCSNLAAIYVFGLDQAQDLVKAKELYSYSCGQGYQDACDNLVQIDWDASKDVQVIK